MRRFLRYRFPVLLLLLLQFLLLLLLWVHSCRFWWIRAGLRLFGILAALRIFCNPQNNTYAKPLILLILLLPELGGFWYPVLHPRRHKKESHTPGLRRFSGKKQAHTGLSPVPENAAFQEPVTEEKILKNAVSACPRSEKLMTFLQRRAGFPVFAEEETCFFPDADAMRDALLSDLSTAEHSVFLEFFILEDGVFWDSVKSVLLERAAAGVRVHLIYDDFGCFLSFSGQDAALLRSAGIHCVSFRPFCPNLSFLQNVRDHRKLIVIDERIAYTGGINLTDEYLGISGRFCDWKDSAVRISGNAVGSFAKMFRHMWEQLTGEIPVPCSCKASTPSTAHSWLQPFASSPSMRIAVWETLFLHLAEEAQTRLWIATPYLTASDEVFSALRRAAESGVDVRLLLPGEADKPLVQFTSRSYYALLLRSGIRIYEYGFGFLHQKLFLCDEEVAVVGSANLDFRSLSFQEECGVCLYRSGEIPRMEEDYLRSLSLSRQIPEVPDKNSLLRRMLSGLCRLIAPLM